MPPAKTTNRTQLLLIGLFIFLFFLTRIPFLEKDVINPDAVNWHYRSEQFVVGLKHKIFEKTFQHYHPGVTLMWLTGVPIEVFKQLSGYETYDRFTFYSFHLVAKYFLVMFQLVLSLFIIYWMEKATGFFKSFFTVALFSFEPFFVGNSRLFHMDIIFTLFVFAALVSSYLYIKEKKLRWAILAGVFAGLSFLTRSIGAGLILYVVFGTAFFTFLQDRKNIGNIIKYAFITLFFSILTAFAFFPALWDKPFYVLSEIFSEGQRVGVRNGHDQIFFGEPTDNAGVFFYPMVILLKFSPLLLIGVVLYKFSLIKEVLKKKKIFSFDLFALLFYFGYFIVMTIPSKKLDRYMLTMAPGIAIMAVYGFYFLQKKMSKKVFFTSLIFGATLFLVIPLVRFYPYYFTYYSPLFVNAKNANFVIGQKPFGVGIYDVKNLLIERYGTDVEVGFFDTKPLKSIFPNSQVFDIRVNGVSDYDVLVLAVNEEMPEKVLESEVKFVQDTSIFINNLEYWRFYVKQNK